MKKMKEVREMTNRELAEAYDVPYPPRKALEEGYWRFIAYLTKGGIPPDETYADVEGYL